MDRRWCRWALCVLPLESSEALTTLTHRRAQVTLCRSPGLSLKKPAASISCLLAHLPGAISFHLRSPITLRLPCKRPHAGTQSTVLAEPTLPAISAKGANHGSVAIPWGRWIPWSDSHWSLWKRRIIQPSLSWPTKPWQKIKQFLLYTLKFWA